MCIWTTSEMRDTYDSSTAYILQLWHGISIKGVIAVLATIYTEQFLGTPEVFVIYFGCMMVDLFLGSIKAKVFGSWKPIAMSLWLRKLVTHLLILALFGYVNLAFILTSGISFSLTNWLLFCMIVTEASSIIQNLTQLGMPVPKVVHVILKILRKQAVSSIARNIDDPVAAKELAEALRDTQLKPQEE